MNIGLGLLNLIGGIIPITVAYFINNVIFAIFLTILGIINLLFMVWNFDGFKQKDANGRKDE